MSNNIRYDQPLWYRHLTEMPDLSHADIFLSKKKIVHSEGKDPEIRIRAIYRYTQENELFYVLTAQSSSKPLSVHVFNVTKFKETYSYLSNKIDNESDKYKYLELEQYGLAYLKISIKIGQIRGCITLAETQIVEAEFEELVARDKKESEEKMEAWREKEKIRKKEHQEKMEEEAKKEEIRKKGHQEKMEEEAKKEEIRKKGHQEKMEKEAKKEEIRKKGHQAEMEDLKQKRELERNLAKDLEQCEKELSQKMNPRNSKERFEYNKMRLKLLSNLKDKYQDNEKVMNEIYWCKETLKDHITNEIALLMAKEDPHPSLELSEQLLNFYLEEEQLFTDEIQELQSKINESYSPYEEEIEKSITEMAELNKQYLQNENNLNFDIDRRVLKLYEKISKHYEINIQKNKIEKPVLAHYYYKKYEATQSAIKKYREDNGIEEHGTLGKFFTNLFVNGGSPSRHGSGSFVGGREENHGNSKKCILI